MNLPKISIVTPSYNQGEYIERTIKSVISQNYPNLEYIIIDGGSNDSSVDIINKYANHISYWTSKPDNGQSDAINKGFSKATGDILGWLNSDDYYNKGTLEKIANKLDVKRCQLVFGNCEYYNEVNDEIWVSDVISNYNSFRLPFDYNYLIQPSTFWTKRLWNRTGPLNVKYHYGFDWEWFMRASKYCKFIPNRMVFSTYCYHKSNKSALGGLIRDQELLSILTKNGFNDYRITIEKMLDNRESIEKIVRFTSNYRIGKVVYLMQKYLNSSLFSKYSSKEVSELYNKVALMFSA